MGPPFGDEQAAKVELRAAMRLVRRGIAADPAERVRRSIRICDRVVVAITSRLDAGQTVRQMLVYEPLPGEPDLATLTRWTSGVGISVFVPEVDGPDLRVQPGDIDPTSLHVVVVPGLAFTADGQRLGQGGGHFDRFLPRLAPGCLRIGVAFAEQVVDVVPTESHDMTVDLVITDR